MSRETLNRMPRSILDPDAETNINLWLLISEEMDVLSEVFESFRKLRSIDETDGIHLDDIGDIVQEDRAGLNDDEYRDTLRVAQKIKLSSGSCPDLIDIAGSICGEHFLSVRELHPGNENWQDEDYLYLDGSWFLDGSFYLSGDVLLASFFEVRIKTITPASMKSALDKAINKARAGGIRYRIKEVEV